MEDNNKTAYRLGKMNQLEVLRLVSIGAYVDGGNGAEILVPKKYLPDDIESGDLLDVFIYHDNEGRLIGTTLHPVAEVGDAALMTCVGTTDAGAFMDWGIHKDIFVPFKEQKTLIHEGDEFVVYLYIDLISRKIVGSTKINKHIGNLIPDYKPGAAVKAIVYEKNEVGFKVIVDSKYKGIIYRNECPMPLNIGAELTAYVVRMREDDKLDLSIKPVGYDKVSSGSDKLMRLLLRHGGKLPVGDKSDPAQIEALTGMSKKTFKMVAGTLYKQKIVEIEPFSIKIINKI